MYIRLGHSEGTCAINRVTWLNGMGFDIPPQESLADAVPQKMSLLLPFGSRTSLPFHLHEICVECPWKPVEHHGSDDCNNRSRFKTLGIDQTNIWQRINKK
jgi:hypothetical protein